MVIEELIKEITKDVGNTHCESDYAFNGGVLWTCKMIRDKITLCSTCNYFNPTIAYCNYYKSCRCSDEFCSRGIPKNEY